MSVQMPDFVKDPHFYVDENGFHLKLGAPSKVQKEFDEYTEYKKRLEARGIEV